MSWKLMFRFGNSYLVLKTPLPPAPNLHDYARWIRPATKPGYQPKKVWNSPTWVETSFKEQCGLGHVCSCLFNEMVNDVLNGWPHDHGPTNVGAMIKTHKTQLTCAKKFPKNILLCGKTFWRFIEILLIWFNKNPVLKIS